MFDREKVLIYNRGISYEEETEMVKHVIIWKLKDEYCGVEIAKIKSEIKEGLEGLKGKIPGLLEIQVHTDPLASSNADLILDSTFEDEASLNGYTVHPEHVAVAMGKVRPFVDVRMCMDYEVNS